MDNKSLIENIKDITGDDPEVVEAFIEALTDVINNCLLSNNTVCIQGFGNFEIKKRNERIITSPSEPEKRLLVPPKVIVNFKPSLILKSKLNYE